MRMKPHHVERMVAGPRLDDLVAEHVMGWKRVKPAPWARKYCPRGFWWAGERFGKHHEPASFPDEWMPSRCRWGKRVDWSQTVEVIVRLHALGWMLDLDDHTRDTEVARSERSWWYELFRNEWLNDPVNPDMNEAQHPHHYVRLDGGHVDPLVAVCHASLKAVLCAGPPKPKRL